LDQSCASRQLCAHDARRNAPGGSRFVETVLTVIETCRQQSRHIFAYVTAAVQPHFADQATPSLFPEA
jgi:hypothetical protein